jgi:MiaB-like tRNA modifying enzyme
MKSYFEIYGCTANKSDAALVKGVLRENNYEIVENVTDADLIIIHTCTVIDTTQQRMLSRLKNLKKLDKKVVVCGCMASVQKDLIKDILPDALFLPPQYSHHIVDLLEDKNIRFVDENKTSFSKYFDNIIAPISIAEGCNFSCSYCITSIARGKLSSYPIDEITNDVSSAIKNGCREIQLTAQDTSSYGLDTGNNLGFLLKNISKIPGKYRVRVGMMNPYTCLKNIDSIIDGFQDYRIYKFLHLPVQSGDNIILKKMNRKYSVEDFFEIIKKFQGKYSDITISTDIIVGFPTESDEQFQNTIELLKKAKPDITNITRFSARPLTSAKKMSGRLKTEIVKKRSQILSKLCNKISLEKNQKHVGKQYNILITEFGKEGTFVGRAENYKPVIIREKVTLGEFISAQIIDAASTYLVGSII